MTSSPVPRAEPVQPRPHLRIAPVPHVLIAGGGIGGLATALALARRGIAAEVLERRTVFGDDGAGIQIGPNGTRILEELGAATSLRARATVPDALRILDAASGRELARFPLGRWIALRHGAPYWALHRRDLHASLVAAAESEPLIRIRKGFDVGAVHEGTEGVAAVSSNGNQTLGGDALIAADGAWSELRVRVFGGGPARFTGKVAMRVVLPIEEVPEALHRTEVHLWLGPDVHVVHYLVSGGHAVALVAVFDGGRIATDWSTPRDRAWVAAQTAGFAPLLGDLLTRPEHWRSWPLLALGGPEPHVAVGRTALLGDAAHPMLPFLAQGGVMALEDAAVVAQALAADPDDPARAFARYAAARRARVRRVARASQMNGLIYHVSGLLAAARNLALARIPPERFMRRYDWLYGWTLPAEDV